MATRRSPTSVASNADDFHERIYPMDREVDTNFGRSKQQPISSKSKGGNRKNDKRRARSRSKGKKPKEVSPKKASEVLKELASKWGENMNSSMRSLEHAMQQLQCRGPNISEFQPCKARSVNLLDEEEDEDDDEGTLEPIQRGMQGRSRSSTKKLTVSSRKEEESSEDEEEEEESQYMEERDIPQHRTKAAPPSALRSSRLVPSYEEEQSCASEYTDGQSTYVTDPNGGGTVVTDADETTLDTFGLSQRFRPTMPSIKKYHVSPQAINGGFTHVVSPEPVRKTKKKTSSSKPRYETYEEQPTRGRSRNPRRSRNREAYHPSDNCSVASSQYSEHSFYA